MEQKYLPIGSVCTLKGKNKKVMITGYYSVEFNGNLRIKDYCGCVYPEGMLLPEQNCAFNHTDIETIDFIGYKNEEQKVFQGLLNRLTGNDVSEEEKAAEFHKENDMFLTSNNTYSKLLFDENGVVMIADPVIKAQKEEKTQENSWKNIKFDENGYVVNVGTNEEINNPFYKEYNNTKLKEETDSSEWNIFNKIEFDENGTVISAETSEDIESPTLSKIEFDENGTVISVNGDTLKEEQNYSKYKFDENGTLIAIGEEQLEEEIPPIGPGLPGYEELFKNNEELTIFDEPKQIYEFDSEGNVVAVNNNNTKEEDIPAVGPGLPGYVEPKKESKYKFDEEGNVISE